MNENWCLCKCFTELYFFHWFVISLTCNFNRCAVCSQSLMDIACRSTQNATHTKINILYSLLCWSVTLLMFIQTHATTPTVNLALVISENQLAVWVILEIFWTVSLKAHDWSSWILTECNLSWKIVKYCILSEVCMINTAPHSTVSLHVMYIKSIKGWFTHPQICCQDFVK